ncbi:hypothetical protein LXA43DRAFT_974257 [Ganoderma leucocontextum]|nr:hypothetical protein LXA43DRAFT_974257 [Ganoderma leucocontextum]
MGGDEAEQHLWACHGTTILPINCSVCGWQFKRVGRFASHQFLHILKKPCNECSKHFASAHERFAHLCERHNLTTENAHLFR